MRDQYPKRLIEVDLPIRRISEHGNHEKNVRQGHISHLHIWWARRPLAACRAVLCAALWPDPDDQDCPEEFRLTAKGLVAEWSVNYQGLHSPQSYSTFRKIEANPKILENNGILRQALIDFISDFAAWENRDNPAFLNTARKLTQIAHKCLFQSGISEPFLLDPFAGGGAIPIEGLRIDCEPYAGDLNPVATLLNEVLLVHLPKHGVRITDLVREWGRWAERKAQAELSYLYPPNVDGSAPVAYLWARTIVCEGPGCGVEVPMIKSLWLAQKGVNSVAIRLVPRKNLNRIDIEIVESVKRSDVGQGTVKRGTVTCPVCGFTTSVDSVRRQLREKHGGSKEARLFAVVFAHNEGGKKRYLTPRMEDLRAVEQAEIEFIKKRKKEPDAFPLEELPRTASGYCAPPTYGANTFSDLFNYRQLIFARWLIDSFDRWSQENQLDDSISQATRSCVALVIDRLIDSNSSQCWWVTIHGETVMRTFGRQSYPIVWDFAEINPFAQSSRGIVDSVNLVANALEQNIIAGNGGTAELVDARLIPLPEDSCSIVFTDPPYYNAIPYSDLADFYYVWLSRLFNRSGKLFSEPLTPKTDEIVEMSGWDSVRFAWKTKAWYEEQMFKAFSRCRLMLSQEGIMVVVFAHKQTSAWEALLSAVIKSGWIITASWPINTENPRRLRAQQSATLGSSVHLVCRPRGNRNTGGSIYASEVGDWRDVLTDLPKRIHEWMPRLSAEGIVGADAIFSCLGPALEIFSRYSHVEKASGEEVTLKEYLEQVWAAVAKEALNMIFEGADATGFEEDSRLTAMWLWTLSTGNNGNGKSKSSKENDEIDDEDESEKAKKAMGGYALEYDAARKIAQGLGAHLEKLSLVVEVKGDTARLLPVSERTRYLFGKDETDAPTTKRKKKEPQLKLGFIKEIEDIETKEGWGAKSSPNAGSTVLDRLHQSMILFAAGRSEALKRFLTEEGAGNDQRFWRLAQALSALYPKTSDEKRWVDGVLARKKGLGF